MATRIRDDELILALLTSKSNREASKKLGCAEMTISRRTNTPQFKKKFRDYRKKLLENVNSKLVNSSSEAVDVLVELLHSKNELTRYNASQKILSLAQDFITLEDLLERIDRLEQAQADN